MIDVSKAIEKTMAKEEYSCYYDTYYCKCCCVTVTSSKVEESENLKLHHTNSNMKEHNCS